MFQVELTMIIDPYMATWLNFKVVKKIFSVASTIIFLVTMDFKVFAM